MKLHSLPHVYVAVYTHYKKNVLLRRAKTAIAVVLPVTVVVPL